MTLKTITILTTLFTLSATSTAMAQDREGSSREASAEDARSLDLDGRGHRDTREVSIERADEIVAHCADNRSYFDGACRDLEWILATVSPDPFLLEPELSYGGDAEMVPDSFLYKSTGDTITVISDEQVSGYDRPLTGQTISDYWVDHKWVLEETDTAEGLIGVITRYEPIRGGTKTGAAWAETDSLEWNVEYEMLQWIAGEPRVAGLPMASVENGCIEENAAVVSTLAAYWAAVASRHPGAISAAYIAVGLAYDALLDCLGL